MRRGHGCGARGRSCRAHTTAIAAAARLSEMVVTALDEREGVVHRSEEEKRERCGGRRVSGQGREELGAGATSPLLLVGVAGKPT